MEIKGYLHIFVETILAFDSTGDIYTQISLGQIAKTQTSKRKSNSQWNEVFMFEVPKEPSRLLFVGYEGENKFGECRYDIQPFFGHAGMAHIIESELYNDENKVTGKVKVKVTYYSGEYGKLRVRVFHLSMVEPFVEKFKEGKLRVILGFHAQSTPIKPLNSQWDEIVELIILQPTLNLVFSVMNQQGILATYTIYNIEKSGLMINETKAYQVSLFNNDKAVGTIKYQIDWIKNK